MMVDDKIKQAMKQRCKESGHIWADFIDDNHYVCKWCGYRKPIPDQVAYSYHRESVIDRSKFKLNRKI